jgi:hypothetical protein
VGDAPSSVAGPCPEAPNGPHGQVVDVGDLAARAGEAVQVGAGATPAQPTGVPSS